MKNDTVSSLDLSKMKTYTLPQSSGAGSMAQQTEVSPELRTRIREYLQAKGYEVTDDAEVIGKSDVAHIFDMLAYIDDGFNSYVLAVCITTGGDRNAEVETIYHFANKCYDCGVIDRVLIAAPEISEEARLLARKQRIKVIDGELVEKLLNSRPSGPIKRKEQLRFETREELIQSLVDLGYSVQEQARIQGQSGVEYIFDVLAHTNTGQVSHTLGLDFLNGNDQVNLEQVTLFDTKAYDAAVDGKVIVVSPDITPEARKFAQHQRIRVIELEPKTDEGPVNEAEEAVKEPEEPVREPEESVKEPAETLPRSKAKSTKLEKPHARLSKQQPEAEALQLIPELVARRYSAIPLTISGKTLEVAMADPSDIFALEALSAHSRMRIRPVAASAKDVRDAIDLNYKGYGEIEKHLSRINIPEEATDEKIALTAATDTPLVQALNLIIEEAVKSRSSDIHIEPEEDRIRVRYRIDGTLHDTMSLPLSVHRALISRIKILGGMNIADHFRPQDGQFSADSTGRDIDIRVATAPTVQGETAVMRILDKSLATLGLSELGLRPDGLARIEGLLRIPYGMLLVSGPTGAGKTTTLYAAINSFDTLSNNVITIEDPAEYRFKSINQIQVNNQAGITFASGLRSILRLDPDVVLVGEIRDSETANIAVQASLTGHLLMSSIHANDVGGVLSRLHDLKVEPFLIASAVIGVIAQRMARRVCPDCSHLIEAPAIEQMAYEKEMGEKKTKFLYGTGCKSCAYSGYRGRTGLFEILTMSDEIGTMICNRASSTAIRAQALKEGMVSMMSDGMHKVKDGITTPSEVLRNAYTGG